MVSSKFILAIFCLVAVIDCRSGRRPSSHHRSHMVKYPNRWAPKMENEASDESPRPSSDSRRSSKPIVHTSWATIEGTIEPYAGTNVSVYYGIPYARPPVGELRFRLPAKIEGRYRGVYNATAPKPACYQGLDGATELTYPISEDCLYLNVWVPRDEEERGGRRSSRRRSQGRRSRGSRGYPVLFYIYGSQFKKHSSTYPINNGGVTAGQGKYIFVNFNHRLQSFGFAYGNNRDMPGNQALYDTLAALEWTKKNIAAFGGDPDRITLSGSSAGGELAAMLSISPAVSPVYFDQALIMNSVPIRPTAIESTRVALNKTKALAAKFGCLEFPNDAPSLTSEQIDCLRKVNESELAEADTTMELTLMGSCPDFAFMPIYGDSFMPLPPDVYVTKGQVRRDIKIMIGTDHYEDVETGNFEPSSRAEAEEILDNMLINMIKPTHNISNELDFIYDTYFDGVSDNDSWALKESFSRVIGDNMFQCPLLMFVEKWALTNEMHLYHNNYTAEGFENSTEARRQHGPGHGMANFMFMGCPFTEYEKYTDKDRLISLKMISVLADFVHDGQINWPPVLSTRGKILPLQWVIDERIDPHTVEVNRKLRMCRFFDKLYHVFY